MKRLAMLACLELAMGALCALGAEFVSVTAENFESCRDLQLGKIYRFAEGIDFAAAPGESAMSLTNGTAGIIVPAGVKVTLAGGAADGVLGGGAGIEVGSKATLYIYGDGELVATGGAAAAGRSGAPGASGSVNVTGAANAFESAVVESRGGSGGAGGNGGGGAGAGLGGRGGSGGAGAPETQTEPVSGGVAAADDGDSGMSGENGGACGEVLVYGSKTFRGGAVTATNQTDGATGDVAHVATNSLFYAAFGGSGGGAGGDGGAAADVGGGGFGGFGGGAGGSGVCKYGVTLEAALSEDEPVRGARGLAGTRGEAGTDGSRLAPTLGSTVNGESVWKGWGNGWAYDAVEDEVVILENGPYDVRGDVSVNGNGHYRVTFPDSPVVLWLENGDYTFRLSTVEGTRVVERYYNAVVNGAGADASEVKPLVLGVKVNGQNVGSLMGEGWTYSPESKLLVLDGSLPYVISGADSLGNVQVAVRGDAEVTLSNLRLGGTGQNADCFRVEGGASVTLALEGTNVLQAVAAGGAGVRVEGTSRLAIDSRGDGATLIVQGGDGAPCVFVASEASLALDGGLLYFSGRTNTTACIGGDAVGTGSLAVTGGTIAPFDELPTTNITCAAVVTGGSIWPDFASVPTNALGQALHRVTVAVGEGGIVVDGLEGYGLKDVQAIDGKIHLWLPDGLHLFKVNGRRCFARVEGGPTVAEPPLEVNYLDRTGEPKEIAAYPVVGGMNRVGGDNWYVATGAMSVATITVSGTANLILADGATLTATGGVRVASGNTLNIYAQSEGAEMGKLTATGEPGCAGIGGGVNETAGTLTVHGGVVTATGGNGDYYGAGIGGGYQGNGGVLTVYGGEIHAQGAFASAGIGGGCYGTGGKVVIFGGTVVARGDTEGAGIGGGYGGAGGEVEIFDGQVTAIAPRGSYSSGAGIGGGSCYERPGLGGGKVVIRGGTVTATSEYRGAGIGGGYCGSCGEVTISGGRVTATGGDGGAGIGGGKRFNAGGAGGTIAISGGTVVASGKNNAADIGAGYNGSASKVTITGGNVVATRSSVKGAPTNDAGEAVYCVTAAVGGQEIVVEGLEGYGVEDVQTIDGKVYFWLPNGEYRFTVDGKGYSATVNGAATEATQVSFVNYLRWNGSKMVEDVVANPVAISDSTKTIGSADGAWYVVTGAVTTAAITVSGTANLILADGAKWTANGGIRVTTGNSLNVYAQSEGAAMGVLVAEGEVKAAGIGGQNFDSCGQVVINGGSIRAKGGRYAAGIGGGRSGSGGKVTINGGNVNAVGGSLSAGIGGAGDDPDASSPSGSGTAGEVTVNGGRVTATGGSAAAGIGGACEGRGGTVTVFGGTIVAKGGTNAADIGSGRDGSFGTVTINGGNVIAMQPKMDGLPQNSAKQSLYCVTLTSEGSEGLLRLDGLEGYGTHDIYAVDGKVCLYLPNGTYAFTVNGVSYAVTVEGRATSAQKSASSNGAALPSSVGAMVASIDLAALMAAPVAVTVQVAQSEPSPRLLSALSNAAGGIELMVRGGVPGAAYVLCAAADLRAFADGAAVTEYGPEICGADGSVTFKGVCRPAEGRGFFTIRCER